MNLQKEYPFSLRHFGFNSKVRVAIVVALTLIGGWLRLSATSFGLPDKFRPDEQFLIRPALDLVVDWNPHVAIYPAAQMYAQHAVLWAWGVTHGDWRNFRTVYAANDQAIAYLIGRRVSAVMGAATIPVLYVAAEPAFGPGAGLATAAITTFCTLHVRESKYATTDAGMTLWLAAAIAMIFRMILRSRNRDYVAAGFFSGLAIATKYPAGVIVFGVAAAHLEARHREGHPLWKFPADHRLYLAAAATIGAFFCFTPYTVLDWRESLRGWSTNASFRFFLHGTGNQLAGHGWSWLMFRAMPDSFGVPGQVLFLTAMLWGLIRPKPGTLSLLAFVSIAFVGMISSHFVFYRYLMVPFPALVLLGGLLIADTATSAANYIGKRRAALTATLGLVLIMAPSVACDIQLNRLLLHTDTRTLARQWIKAHIPRGSRIAFTDKKMTFGKPQSLYDYEIVPLDLHTIEARNVRWVLSDELAPLAFYSRGPSEAELFALDSEATLVFDVNPLTPGTPAPIFDANDAFYAPIRHISNMRAPGPRIRIWELKETRDEHSRPFN